MAVGVAKVEEDSGMRFHMSKYVGVNMFLNLYPACKGFHFWGRGHQLGDPVVGWGEGRKDRKPTLDPFSLKPPVIPILIHTLCLFVETKSCHWLKQNTYQTLLKSSLLELLSADKVS